MDVYYYTKSNQKYDKEVAINMTTKFVKKIQNIDLPPHQLRELGLSRDWQKKEIFRTTFL